MCFFSTILFRDRYYNTGNGITDIFLARCISYFNITQEIGMTLFISLFTLSLFTACSDKSTDDDDTNSATEDSANVDIEEGPTIWDGPNIIFSKESNADPTDPANQDAITANVILTRGQQGALFNVVIETSAGSSSPEGTEWAKGTTEDLDTLEFTSLKPAASNQLQSLPGESFVLHLIEEDIYIDLTFISWESGGVGGGFSYERSTQSD